MPSGAEGGAETGRRVDCGFASGPDVVFSEGSVGGAQAQGEPGTGKSHLIRWLKLRSDYAAGHGEFGLEKFKLVLVERRFVVGRHERSLFPGDDELHRSWRRPI